MEIASNIAFFANFILFRLRGLDGWDVGLN